MFHLRKTTLIGLILLLAGAAAVALANPEQRVVKSYDNRLEMLKSELTTVESSKYNPLQTLDTSDREAVKSLDEFLKTYQMPEKYRFATMRKLAILVLSTEPVMDYLAMNARTALPAPKGELASAETAPAPTGSSVAPSASAPPKSSKPTKPSFKIVDDEGC